MSAATRKELQVGVIAPPHEEGHLTSVISYECCKGVCQNTKAARHHPTGAQTRARAATAAARSAAPVAHKSTASAYLVGLVIRDAS